MAIKPPRLSGSTLSAVRIAAETKGTDAAVREVMKRGLGLDRVAALPEAWRGEVPLDVRPVVARSPRVWSTADLGPLPRRSWPRSAASFHAAYRERVVSPRRVVERALAEIDRLAGLKPCMNIATAVNREGALRDAEASEARFAEGRPRGLLDGVPLLVKDEFDLIGFATSLGVRCQPQPIAERDATLVDRLKRAGMIVLAKTVLTEWGMSPIGANVHQAMPHNAHDPTKAPGGSSTGSGVGVALGLAPLACGGDGGGSIRIPAALNGVYGIKPTFGRVSRAGDGFKGTVEHAGPIGGSTADLALFLDAAATDPDPLDPITSSAPRPPEGGFGALLGAGVRGLRVGVDEASWRDASVPVAEACRAALSALVKDGAVLVEVNMPIAEYAAQIGYLTIGPESIAQNRRLWMEQKDLLGDDLRLAYAVLSGITAAELIDAQRLRAGLRRELADVLQRVDVLALPTTVTTAPRYTEEDEKVAISDPAALEALVRHAFLANLTGAPAGTAPVGMDPGGLPVGLQIVGDAWDEAAVLGVMAHLERTEVAVARRPLAGIDLLSGG